MRYIIHKNGKVVHAVESDILVEYPDYTTRPCNALFQDVWNDVIKSPGDYVITSESPLTLAKETEKTYDKHNNNGVG